MKSSLVNMVVVLFLITAAGAAAVGGVYSLTKDTIAQAKQQNQQGALSLVLPEFDNDPSSDMEVVEIDGRAHNVYRSAKGGKVNGYAVESSAPGFSDAIKILVGFDPDGDILNIEVLEQSETPGLGAKLAEADNPVRASIVGRNPGNMKLSVRKDGGEVDAITASTISSRAYALAVQWAYDAFRTLVAPAPATDASQTIIMEEAIDE